jgi:hypothetical protein
MSNSHSTGQTPGDWGNEAAELKYFVQSMLAGMRTAMPVLVTAVSNAGGLSPIGTVSIKPLVSQIDGNGNAFEHGIIYKARYLRLQGGANGVIIDPEVNDIGLACFCDRDISAVIASGDAAPPGSKRRHDMSDAVYVMTILGSAPTQYVQFNSSGITVHSPNKVTISAPVVEVNASTSATITSASITLNGSIQLNGPISQGASGSGGTGANLIGPLTVTNDVTAAGKSVSTHHHTEHDGPSTSGPI